MVFISGQRGEATTTVKCLRKVDKKADMVSVIATFHTFPLVRSFSLQFSSDVVNSGMRCGRDRFVIMHESDVRHKNTCFWGGVHSCLPKRCIV